MIAQTMNEFKYIYAQKIGDSEWQVISFSNFIVPLDETSMYESIPMGEMKRAQFAIFRTGVQWENKRPLRLLDMRDRRDTPIPASVGMWVINQAHSGML